MDLSLKNQINKKKTLSKRLYCNLLADRRIANQELFRGKHQRVYAKGTEHACFRRGNVPFRRRWLRFMR